MHKGFSLALMLEVLTAGLTGLLPEDAKEDEESNSACLIVIDPKKFLGVAAFQKAVESLKDAVSQDTEQGARLPGARA